MNEVDHFMSRLMSNLDGSKDEKIAALVKALQRIAEQQLSEERLVEGGDYEYGYEQIIKIAREALAVVGSARSGS
jgi:hypothetical protein